MIRRSPPRSIAKTLERAFELNRQLRNVDKIFARVFGTGERVKSARK